LAKAIDRSNVSHSQLTKLGRAPQHRVTPRARGEFLSSLGKAGDLANADPFLAVTLSNVYSILPPSFAFGDIPEFDGLTCIFWTKHVSRSSTRL
jgi:hypothetical protein